MKNPVFYGLAAANTGGGTLVHPVAEHRSPRNCAPVTRQGTGVFAARVAAPRAAAATSQHITISKYQDMTRTGAAGGSAPGSPPVWDPV